MLNFLLGAVAGALMAAVATVAALRNPDVAFVKPCNLCPHMKRITLRNIREALETMTHEITVEEGLAERARLAVERMLAVKPTQTVSPRQAA